MFSRSVFRSSLIRKEQVIKMNREISQITVNQIQSHINKLETEKKNLENQCLDLCSFQSQRYTFEKLERIQNFLCNDVLEYISEFYKRANHTCIKNHTSDIEYLEKKIYLNNEIIREILEKYEDSVVQLCKDVSNYREKYGDGDLYFECFRGEFLKLFPSSTNL